MISNLSCENFILKLFLIVLSAAFLSYSDSVAGSPGHPMSLMWPGLPSPFPVHSLVPITYLRLWSSVPFFFFFTFNTPVCFSDKYIFKNITNILLSHVKLWLCYLVKFDNFVTQVFCDPIDFIFCIRGLFVTEGDTFQSPTIIVYLSTFLIYLVNLALYI